MKVPVLDTNKQQLAPTTERRARLLLTSGKAAVFRRYPFVIILKHVIQPENVKVPTIYLKLDPGSKTTGIALVDQDEKSVIFGAELQHHSQLIKSDMENRASIRGGRRARKTRYRKARFNNRKRAAGWFSPSVESRLSNIVTWVRRLLKYYPISNISIENVRFDIQKLANPEIDGVQYQQGELFGYELREYLLLKYKHTCVYATKGTCSERLEIEHITPISRGGTNRISNLTISCDKHNREKNTQTAVEFGFPSVTSGISYANATAVNITRKEIVKRLSEFGLDIELASGGLTKFNRVKRDLPKIHWIDAACVGHSTPRELKIENVKPLLIKSMGHGNRKMCQTDKYGFPVKHRTRNKSFEGWKTGDIVKAKVTSGVNEGEYFGRITIRQRKSFTLNGIDMHPKYMTRVSRGDGYKYE